MGSLASQQARNGHRSPSEGTPDRLAGTQNLSRQISSKVTLRATLEKGATKVSPRQYVFAWYSLLKKGDRHAVVYSEDGTKPFLVPEDLPKSLMEFDSYFTP